MKASFLYLAAALVAATASAAETPAITKIPFYYHQKRSSSDDFISAASEDLQNGMLGGVIQIGNPPQNFTVAFDTSSGFTWVRSVLCESENCQGRNAYDARNSTSAVSTGRPFQTTSYGNAVARTTIYQDTFRFAGMTVKHMPFGGAYDMQGFDEGFDGFLGLGRDVDLNITSPQKRDVSSSGFVANAYQQGSGISSAQFGMYTTSSSGFSQSGSTPAKRSVKREDPAGYLIFGGVDKEAIQGDLYHIDTDKDNGSGNWVVPVKQAEFLKELDFKVDKHAKAVLSSSTDVIGLPNSQADKFQKHWYAEYDKPDNTFKIPCCLMDRLTSLQMTLGDIQVTLPPSYWSHPRDTTSCCDMCRTHIGKSESDTDYVIGYSFTNAFYSQFNPEKNRISLAYKKHQEDNGLKLCKV